MKNQECKSKVNFILKDNESTVMLANNGKDSSGKRTRHFDIEYFYTTDILSRDEVVVEYCPTNNIIANYMLELLVGYKFDRFRNAILNNNA
eukprot:9157766-Ditylum_brightwellii.AAC.1